jgi:NAD(P)-dependent dehydrogenase (short-subunit alcohol dehydrogenase family)
VGAAVAVGGSVLTEGDERALAAQGVDATFGPYTPEETIVARLDELVARSRGDELAGPRVVHRSALAGRVVIVTGAARGLGRAYTELLVREGAAVIANDLDGDELVAADAITPVAGDVADTATPTALVRAALDRYGRLDAIVCNAGLLRSGLLVKITPEDFDAVHAVHVRGTFLLLQAAARRWRTEAKSGRPVEAAVVTTTSSAGLYGFLGEAAYSAAKAAIAAMTLVAAAELERYGVTVNAVAPAARTRMTTWMGEAPEDQSEDPYAAAHVAPVLAWLVSSAARHVTGRVFEVGGDRIAVGETWRQVAGADLPRNAEVADAGALVEQLLADAPPSREIQRAVLEVETSPAARTLTPAP